MYANGQRVSCRGGRLAQDGWHLPHEGVTRGSVPPPSSTHQHSLNTHHLATPGSHGALRAPTSVPPCFLAFPPCLPLITCSAPFLFPCPRIRSPAAPSPPITGPLGRWWACNPPGLTLGKMEFRVLGNRMRGWALTSMSGAGNPVASTPRPYRHMNRTGLPWGRRFLSVLLSPHPGPHEE